MIILYSTINVRKGNNVHSNSLKCTNNMYTCVCVLGKNKRDNRYKIF